MSSEIEEIKSRLNIVDVLSGYIKLEKAGINYRACCPFHKEKTPSFFVSPSRQLWHCFGGCNEGGDMFKFVMKIENVEFKEALKILAHKAGVELKTVNVEQEKRQKTEKETCASICELSAKFFELYLEKTSIGKKAEEYLKDRGLSDVTIKEWRLGYSTNSWSKLAEFLIGKGFERSDIVKAGVAIEKEGNKFFDRFRGRIIFPICDMSGRVVGFTGRIFGENNDSAKYLNTPNTILYDKSKIIFGLDKAKESIRENEFCILVEGNMDCIMSHQAGMKNCVAVSGTALTEQHLNILKRYTNKLVLSFDMDFAGNNATKKAIRQAQLLDFEIKIVPSFGEKDPADIILHEGGERWKEIVAESKPINEFYFDSAIKSRDPKDIKDKKLIASDFLPIIKQMLSNIERAYWIGKISDVLDISERDIIKELETIRIEEGIQEREDTKNDFLNLERKTRGELIDEELAILILLFPEKIDLIGESLLHSFTSPIKDLLLKIKEKRDIKTEEVVNSFQSDDNHFNYINYLLMKSELNKNKDIDIDKEIGVCLKEKSSISKKAEQKKLSKEIKELEKKGDFEQIKVLSEKFNKLSQNNNE
ncbi:MAG: DNA primase [Candidatus Pacebacteria bacterium]|nr:DNA primase [Candidatus Paceibacterota bacterium]